MKSFLVTFLLSTTLNAMTLQEAEQAAVMASGLIASFPMARAANDHNSDAVAAGLLPKLNLQYSKGRSEVRDAGSPSPFTNWSGELRATLPNPWTYRADRDGVELERALLELDQSDAEHALLYTTRRLYFKVKLGELEVEQANRYLKTFQSVTRIAEIKYREGRIHMQDRDRAEVAELKQNKAIADLEAQLNNDRGVLAIHLAARHPVMDFATQLPARFDTSYLPVEWTKDRATERALVQAQQENTRLDQGRAGYLPEFFVAAARSKDNVAEQTSYSVGLSWTLSPQNYFKNRGLEASWHAAESRAVGTGTDARAAYSDLLAQLRKTEASIVAQAGLLKTQTRISDASLEQYNRGYLTLSQFYDDLRLTLDEEAALLKLRFDAVDLLAQISQKVGDRSVFYKAL